MHIFVKEKKQSLEIDIHGNSGFASKSIENPLPLVGTILNGYYYLSWFINVK